MKVGSNQMGLTTMPFFFVLVTEELRHFPLVRSLCLFFSIFFFFSRSVFVFCSLPIYLSPSLFVLPSCSLSVSPSLFPSRSLSGALSLSFSLRLPRSFSLSHEYSYALLYTPRPPTSISRHIFWQIIYISKHHKLCRFFTLIDAAIAWSSIPFQNSLKRKSFEAKCVCVRSFSRICFFPLFGRNGKKSF